MIYFDLYFEKVNAFFLRYTKQNSYFAIGEFHYRNTWILQQQYFLLKMQIHEFIAIEENTSNTMFKNYAWLIWLYVSKMQNRPQAKLRHLFK